MSMQLGGAPYVKQQPQPSPSHLQYLTVEQTTEIVPDLDAKIPDKPTACHVADSLSLLEPLVPTGTYNYMCAGCPATAGSLSLACLATHTEPTKAPHHAAKGSVVELLPLAELERLLAHIPPDVATQGPHAQQDTTEPPPQKHKAQVRGLARQTAGAKGHQRCRQMHTDVWGCV